ncbi:SCAN domain-containing protein 3 [Trichonephila clavipes]|nr:SCAN domain-containing protein 3 [Trichonephila clavipes]
MKNLTSCAADGAPNMMGKKNGCLKLMEDANPEMILVHCVIHRQNLIAKNISPVLNEVLHNVIKCVNVIKSSAKCERLFKLFCEEQNEDHRASLPYTAGLQWYWARTRDKASHDPMPIPLGYRGQRPCSHPQP